MGLFTHALSFNIHTHYKYLGLSLVQWPLTMSDVMYADCIDRTLGLHACIIYRLSDLNPSWAGGPCSCMTCRFSDMIISVRGTINSLTISLFSKLAMIIFIHHHMVAEKNNDNNNDKKQHWNQEQQVQACTKLCNEAETAFTIGLLAMNNKLN